MLYIESPSQEKNLVYRGGQFKPLSDERVKIMNEGTLRILENTGVKVFTKTGREHFKRVGAKVNQQDCVVHIHRSITEDAITSASHRLGLCGRDPKHDAVLEGGNVYLGAGGVL